MSASRVSPASLANLPAEVRESIHLPRGLFAGHPSHPPPGEPPKVSPNEPDESSASSSTRRGGALRHFLWSKNTADGFPFLLLAAACFVIAVLNRAGEAASLNQGRLLPLWVLFGVLGVIAAGGGVATVVFGDADDEEEDIDPNTVVLSRHQYRQLIRQASSAVRSQRSLLPREWAPGSERPNPSDHVEHLSSSPAPSLAPTVAVARSSTARETAAAAPVVRTIPGARSTLSSDPPAAVAETGGPNGKAPSDEHLAVESRHQTGPPEAGVSPELTDAFSDLLEELKSTIRRKQASEPAPADEPRQ